MKGNINIAGGNVNDIASGEKPFMFEVQCSMTNGGGEVLVLNAPSAADKAAWMECLRAHTKTSDLSPRDSFQALKQKLTELKQDHVFNFLPNLSAESHLFKQVICYYNVLCSSVLILIS